jgi:transcriptional regulator with XRE-family HTH domain
MLGTKLRQLRNEHKLSQDEVAEYIGIAQSAYNRKESDQSQFKANELFKLAELYKVPIEKLFPENACMQFQENKDYSNHNGFIIYASDKEIQLLQEQNTLLKETNALLKSKVQELENRSFKH